MTQTSKAQDKTLRTVVANGGEMNGYAGQRGFDGRSVETLVSAGLLECVADCASCSSSDDVFDAGHVCDRPLAGQRGGERCWDRVRITETGRKLVA